MFESLVANLVNRFLGSYIENFDPKQLNIGIWSGDVKLHNLRLKKESLDKFRLPVDVKFGHLGELTLQIPWSNLKSKPVKVIIEDVYLLASPVLADEYDEEEEKRRELSLKREKLDDLAAIEAATAESLQGSNETRNETFTESLVTKIVDNLQVTIKNIHVRYEDDSVLTENPYAAGVVLNELSAVSTDGDWTPSFISITQAFTHKLLTLKNFSIYMNTTSEMLYTDNFDELLETFKGLTTLEAGRKNLEYLLNPVSGEGRLTVHKRGATDEFPHAKCELFFDEFGIDIDSDQYRDLLWTASTFHWHLKTKKFRKLRPRCTVSENPKEWFRYAANSILNEVHEKNYRWSWEYMAKRRDQRKAYIKFWKSKLLNQPLSSTDEEQFKSLETDLPFEDLKFYRQLAKSEMHKQKQSIVTTEDTKTPQNSAGWFSGWWGKPSVESENTNSSDFTLSDEERKAFHEAIEYDENRVLAESLNIPRDRTKFEVSAVLKKGGLSIRKSRKSPHLAEIVFEDCAFKFFQRPDSYLVDFQLVEFKVEDGTHNTLYKHVVSVKHPHLGMHPEQSQDDSLTISSGADPFFHISFEHNPLDQSADSRLLGKLKSMTIFYNPQFIEEVIRFFTPPKIHLDTVGAIMNAAEATMEGITTQTKLGLQYALEEHKTINVKLDLQAPLIILPLDPNDWKSPVAILDAGHISVVSDLVEKSKIEEIKAKQNYTSDDWKQLNNLMYDKFSLTLSDTQFFVGPTIKSTMLQLHSEDENRSTLILDKLNLNLSFGISILPEAYSLARFKIGGEIPEIKLALSDFQYKTIMKIIDTSIPTLQNDDVDMSSIFETYQSENKLGIDDLETTSSHEVSSSRHNGTGIQGLGAQQRLFELSFIVSRVFLSVTRTTDITDFSNDPIADLIGDSLHLELFKTSKDLQVELSLAGISLIDHIEKSGVPEFSRLISSDNIDEQENIASEEKKDLFKLNYKRSSRILGNKGTEVEVFDQDVSVDFATVKFIISRKSILNILSYILNTFQDPTDCKDGDTPAITNYNDNENLMPERINVNVNLESIIMVLNDDGVKLATLKLSKASFQVFMLPEDLKVHGMLGALSLHNDIDSQVSQSSPFVNLVSIEGDNLARFKYETSNRDAHNDPFNTYIEFSTESAIINYDEDAFSKILSFLSKFQRMKAIYDKARDAAINQANQIDYANKIKFDVLVKAPIVVFPKLSGVKQEYNSLTTHLGEIYATNTFEPDATGAMQNLIKAGIRNVSLDSVFHFDQASQLSQLVEGLDLSFSINYLEEATADKQTFTITGKMPDLHIHLSDLQLQYLVDLNESVLRVLSAISYDDDDSSMVDIKEDAAIANAVYYSDIESSESKKAGISNDTSQGIVVAPDHKKVVFNFSSPILSLTLYNNTSNEEDISKSALTSFTMNDLQVNFTLTEDTHFSTGVSVESFVVKDMRQNATNKFTEIIPPISDGDKQFYVKVYSDGKPNDKTLTVVLDVDRPQVILALDYIFELQSFLHINSSEPKRRESLATSDVKSKSDDRSRTLPRDADSPVSKFGFCINIKNPSLILLADSSRSNTEAVVFKVESILLSSQNIISLAANNIGMFLCSMGDTSDKRLRIIDDFSVSFAYDSRGSSQTKFLSCVEASVDPMLLRVSLRDIRLAYGIFNRATELYNQFGIKNTKEDGGSEIQERFQDKISDYFPSVGSDVASEVTEDVQDEQLIPAIVKGEELTASFGGLRFVLIGDIHELPALDINIKPFEAKVNNWSTDFAAEAHIETFMNIFNYSRSTWEPLVEAWFISIYASKTLTPSQSIQVDVVSRDLAEVNVSSRSVALLSHVFSVITTDESLKPRDEDEPYRIINNTGFDIEVWNDKQSSPERSKKVIKENEVLPWSFEDWRKIRENLDSDSNSGFLGVKILNTSYERIGGISVNGEGEDLFVLYPPIEGVHDRMSCEVTLGEDNIKTIWLRSTIKVVNDAEIPLVIQISGDNSKEILIDSKTTNALPIDKVYNGSFRLKPKFEQNYNWSPSLNWTDLSKGGMALSCKSLSQGDDSFYIHTDAKYDQNEPLCKIYPHMSLIISAPIEIENLLPVAFDYRLYDKSTKKDWCGSVSKGVKKYIHVVSLQSLLLLSVQPKDCGFDKSEFAIINSLPGSDFKKENVMTLRHKNGQILRLKIHYPKRDSKSASLKVVVYSPYVILNKTSQDIIVSEKGNMMKSSSKSFKPTVPSMFSFFKDSDTTNRALIKVNDTAWTSPISLDAIGQSTAAKAQINGKQAEMNIGITINEGEGKYKLSKVITVAPRYIFRNGLDEEVEIVENGSTRLISAESQGLVPLYGLRRTDQKNLMLKFRNNSSWSSPFCIDDIGQVFLKVHREDLGQVLLKISILLENATIFIHLENANNNWPFSIKNFSDQEFFIYQGDPNVDENGNVVKRDIEYKPIFYKIPPKSVMPYAYDYPNALIKELILRSHGRERAINLAEIGNLKPFRIPPTQNSEQSIVDLNVVADGPTQSLVISNYDPSVSLYKLKSDKSSVSLSQQQFEAVEKDENYHTRIITRFEGFGISLINTRSQELCYITLRGIEIRYNESDLYQNLSVKLKWIQIDNQLFGGIFPIVLYPSVVPKSGKEMNNHPSISGAICKIKDDQHGTLMIKYATILIQEMTIEIDEDFLFALLDFAKFPGASWNRLKEDKLCEDVLELPKPVNLKDSTDVYFEALHLQPALLNLSFVRTERVNVEDRTSSQNTLMFFFNVLTMAIGNINDAPIKLNALFIEHIRLPLPLLMEAVQTHYGQAFFYQVHKVLGSADLIGNPVGLFNNISSGVMDIFYEPYQGFVINDRPQELGISIAKGGLSFLKKSIFGFSDSVAKVTGSLAKGLTVVTLDKKFQERRRLNQRRNKPKHALYGFASGANSFFESISSGVTGFATAPLEGANRDGASGFFKGLGKGFVGLPTKTAIGFFDLASNVSEGIRNTTTVFDEEGLDKVRLPRFISSDQVIRSYDQREAQGQYWLKTIDGGFYFSEKYLAHLLLAGQEVCVLVTYKIIILFEVNTLKSKWSIPLEQIKSISNEPTGISITLKRANGPFIPIPDRVNRTFLYRKIGVAVEQYNKHCQVFL
ncbi:Piso0_003790 [Millerozyma farinosa CBS 7064]|uniref:Vacuolar protein sorting-associated protein n=1 Tax=Pichia sorbitophila (strain ATCC MYA-4447 / BCRC 22081 / CBS 7064 / NBRC 10061 / NRRL Y-12695) TaxID=559304 RepID=G8Y6L9_PICSO|nr:Piso0_003790 [Millerozyma farinosa CBS 7064]CCE84249.1 Piso0_003790 [Millerozyma farinosa CBS 7064]